MIDELKEFISNEINKLVVEPTVIAFHGMTDEENAEFKAYMKILSKIEEIEQNEFQ